MKQIYATLGIVCMTLCVHPSALFAQSPTTVAPSNLCNVVEDFNDDNGGFRSPSLYTESSYTEFSWNQQLGYWMEATGQASRSASMISGVYENKQTSGGLVIGFKYNVPEGSEFRIRVINVNCSCTGGNDILATTASGDVWTSLSGSSGRLCIKLLDADLAKGQNVRFEISIRSNTTGNFIVDDFSLTEVEESPLPVTFLGFVANKTAENAIQVKWDVAEEINVKEYQVERSVDGRTYSVIGAVMANGKPVYSYVDGRPAPGAAYYRVKNVDWDGKSKYTSVIKMNSSGTTYGSTLRAYPTPAQDQVTIEHKKLSTEAKITISTIDGRTLKTIIPANGASHTPVNLSGMPKGVYIVRLEDGQNVPETSKLIKQ